MEEVIPTACYTYQHNVKAILEWQPHYLIKQFVEQSGFLWVSQMKCFNIDRNLIGAFVQLFDKGSNTFVINGNNYMITLEDVLYLTSLTVDGEPVAPKEGVCKDLCIELLGIAPPPPPKGGKTGFVSLDWLKKNFADVGAIPSEERIERCARAYLLYIIGTLIFPNKTVTLVPGIYLNLLRDFNNVKSYAWGSAMLECLLESLATCKRHNPHISGNVALLMFWAYEHFPNLAPSKQVERTIPLMVCWSHQIPKSSFNVHNSESILYLLNKITNIPEEQMRWQPYVGIPMVEGLAAQKKLKSSCTMLICLDKYRWYRPDLCLAQFGPPTRRPNIPLIPKYRTRCGTKDANIDWRVELKIPNELWDARWDRLIIDGRQQDDDGGLDISATSGENDGLDVSATSGENDGDNCYGYFQSPSGQTSSVDGGKEDDDHILDVSAVRGQDVVISESICQFWVQGNCINGDQCRNLHSWYQADGLEILAKLQGHKKAVTGIALPERSNKLYSGSSDGTVRIWDCHTAHCARVINVGGEVGSIVCEGVWVVVGIPNIVKAWNTESGSEYSLDGPIGQVYSMATTTDMLFAGVEDGVILAWKGNNETDPPLQLVASLKGHTCEVLSLVIGQCKRLYSGSRDKTIRVWDHEALQCIMTLEGHTDAISSLIYWDQYLFSCSLDCTIKVWATTEQGNLEVISTHNEEHGILALFGMAAGADAKPILYCSCTDHSVHLHEMPSFAYKGKLFAKQEVRAIQRGPEGLGLFFTGDQTGLLTVWKWLDEPQ